MPRRRQHGTPLVVPPAERGGTVSRLERLRFDTIGQAGEIYDEQWLQHLIHAHPELLPIREIEPAFEPAIPVCIELPTRKGFIDNFFVTPTGNLLFAECKLWRNPEARRQVIAQVMDYVESITSWSYAALEEAVTRAQLPDGSRTPNKIYDLVSASQELDEQGFVDAVSRNLRLGRGLFFVVGDGIREETESLTAHLQAHAGIHFALALVELGLFRLPTDGVLIQPRMIARTVNIERGIVRLDDARTFIEPVPIAGPRSPRAESLSEDEFYREIAKGNPALPDRLRAFLDRLEPIGITPDFRRTLILRFWAPDGTGLNLGYISTNGATSTSAINWGARELGILDIAHDYVRDLAEAIHGEIRAPSNSEDHQYVVLDGHVPAIEDMLEHEDAWARAIERLCRRVTERLETRTEQATSLNRTIPTLDRKAD
jgi:hypothetical protein